MAKVKLVPIRGSERKPVSKAERIGPARPDERVEVTVRLRRRSPLKPSSTSGTAPPRERKYFTHGEYAKAHGADPKDIAKVVAFAKKSGLVVLESSVPKRMVRLSGTVESMNQAFGVTLENWQHPGGTYRGRTGLILVPSTLAEIVVGVFGLDNRPFAKPHFRPLSKSQAGPGFQGYSPTQVAQFYNFPEGVDGTGQVIGIIELGGGYRPRDLKAYFSQIGVKVPNVSTVSVDRGRNHPTTAQSADGEVMLDIEVAAAVAPGAKIVVYFAHGATDQDFLDAITQAVHDSVNNPSVISISWGGPEASASASFQTQFDEVLQSAAALGITVTIASGDNGAADEGPNEWDNVAHADFPASSPFALGCGGTNIQVAGTQISQETVWNQHAADTQYDSFGASGGGISDFFPVPQYQAATNLPNSVATGKSGRGVPDVSGDGDPASGYLVRVDGQEFPIGGTSAVAPLWAGLIALINQKLGTRAGFINPILYANPGALRNVTSGDNKVGNQNIGYQAGPGWNACTGLGSPDGVKLLALLQGGSTPQPKKLAGSKTHA